MFLLRYHVKLQRTAYKALPKGAQTPVIAQSAQNSMIFEALAKRHPLNPTKKTDLVD
jgi:hypothetical protein